MDMNAGNMNTSPPAQPTPAGGEAGGAAAQGQHQAAGFSSPAADANGAPPLPFQPVGLDAGFVGKDDRETIERLSVALQDMKSKMVAHAPPTALEAYSDFSGVELPDTIKGHMEGLSQDPIFKTAAAAAQKHGVSQQAMQEIVTGVYASAAENGLLEAAVDVEAERLALLPDGYANQPKAVQDGAINARLQANVDFMQLLVKNGKVDGATAEHVCGMLMDTAMGNKFLEFVRGQATGGNMAQPFGQQGSRGGGGVNAGALLRDELARVEAKRGTVEYDPTEHEAVMARYRSLYGE